MCHRVSRRDVHRFVTSNSALSLCYWDLHILKNNADNGVFILVYTLKGTTNLGRRYEVKLKLKVRIKKVF